MTGKRRPSRKQKQKTKQKEYMMYLQQENLKYIVNPYNKYGIATTSSLDHKSSTHRERQHVDRTYILQQQKYHLYFKTSINK